MQKIWWSLVRDQEDMAQKRWMKQDTLMKRLWWCSFGGRRDQLQSYVIITCWNGWMEALKLLFEKMYWCGYWVVKGWIVMNIPCFSPSWVHPFLSVKVPPLLFAALPRIRCRKSQWCCQSGCLVFLFLAQSLRPELPVQFWAEVAKVNILV